VATLKVYGWTGMAPGMPHNQARFIVAAHSVAEVLRLTGMTRHQFNQNGCETGNLREVSRAMREPGTVFYRGLDAWRDEPWLTHERSQT